MTSKITKNICRQLATDAAIKDEIRRLNDKAEALKKGVPIPSDDEERRKRNEKKLSST